MLKRVSGLVLLLGCATVWLAAAPTDLFVYIGTYTGPKSMGIYISRLDVTTGALSEPHLSAETPNPSFLAVRPQEDFLYAVNEVDSFDGQKTGSVSAFRVARTSGMLFSLNQRSSGGPGPAHLSVDGKGTAVLVANYGGGSVETLPIEKNGRLGAPVSFIQHTGSSVNLDRQKEPHAHQIIVDPSNRFAYVADLGIDKVMIYRFDTAKSSLAAATPASAPLKPGAGPRHVAIAKSGRFAYVINELNCTITVFERNGATGALTEIQTASSLPPGVAQEKGFSTAEIRLAPSGAFLYGSNRGHDSISVFAVDQASGKLTFVSNTPTGGRTPRGFAIEPGGGILVAGNQNSDTVVTFKIDRASGKLTPAGASVTVGAPVDFAFVHPIVP
jgi:6-phosphogluconolactonase